MKKYIYWVCLVLVVFLPSVSHAEEGSFIQWQSTNVQLLRGFDYEIGAQDRTIATFEHAHGHRYGDFYMFVDYTWPDGGDENYYAEFSPRLSLGKVTGKDFSYGLIKDVFISTTIEKPEDQKARYLYGGAVDLNLPGFKFFKTNLYVRDDPNLDKTYQVTLGWNRPFEIKGQKFLIEGFADFSGDAGAGKEAHQLIVPRFLMDVGHATGLNEGKLFMGVEWQYWHNKFGVGGVTESVPQLQMKYTF